MTKRHARYALVIGALALVVLNLPLGDPPARPSPLPDADVPVSVPQDAVEPEASSATANKPVALAAPLPPPGTPVATLADALKPLADAGDSRAACRLAVELLRCRRLQQHNELLTPDTEPADVRLARAGHPELADRLAEMAIRKIQFQQDCNTLDPTLLEQAPHYLAMAAHAGEPEAMLRYAIGEHHGMLGLGFTADPDFERWRQASPAMLLRAARAGRTEAVHLLHVAYGSDTTPFAGLVDDDPVQAYVWGIVRSKLSGGPVKAPESLDAAARAHAEALAARWQQRHFKDASTRASPPALFLPGLGDPMQSPEQERFCE